MVNMDCKVEQSCFNSGLKKTLFNDFVALQIKIFRRRRHIPLGCFDVIDDGFLDAKEFHDVSHLMSLRRLYVEPILVFPAIQVKHDYDFLTTQHVEDAVPGDHSEDSRAQVFSRACENFLSCSRIAFLLSSGQSP